MLSYSLGEGAELRSLEPWNAAEFIASIERDRAHLAPWLPWSGIKDEESARAMLQNYADQQAQDGGRIYGIWLDGELSGGVLFRVFSVAAGDCEVGVWLAAEAEGRGLVTRAVRHMIDWAFHARGIARVEWQTSPANERSIAVARRLGMTKEGTLRQAFMLNGTRVDVEVWSVLAGEWNAVAAQLSLVRERAGMVRRTGRRPDSSRSTPLSAWSPASSNKARHSRLTPQLSAS
jgi:ribosomal-protein-serine acetyltransferase